MPTYGNKKDKRYAYGFFEHEIGDIDELGWYKMYYIPSVSLTEDSPLLDQIRYSNFFEKNITRKDLHGTRQKLMNRAEKLKAGA